MSGPTAALRGPRRRLLRSVLVVVLVFNVTLGMAFSVIGIRQQAGNRAGGQLALQQQMTVVNWIRAEVWRSVAVQRATPALAGLDLAALTRGVSPQAAGSVVHAQTEAFAVAVSRIRTELAGHDLASARRNADGLTTTTGALVSTLNQLARVNQRSSARANTMADVETVLLMLFAAGMGLVLFRRVLLVRINGDVRAAQAKATAEATFGSLVRHSSDLISIVDIQFLVRYQTPSLLPMLGYPTGALVGSPLLEIVHPDDQLRLLSAHEALLDGADAIPTTVRMRAADGGWRHVESVHNDLRSNADVRGIAITSRDVTERVSLQERLRHSAFHDDLTGLANRALFTDRVEHALSRRYDPAKPPAVVFLDVDDFKSVNDSLGHHVGDELLTVTAQRLARSVRHSDTVARLGGDEFALLIEDLEPAECLLLVERLRDDLREPIQLAGREVAVHTSIGVAHAGAEDANALLSNADLAMYAAKAAGKDAVLQFEPAMAQRAVRRLHLKTELQSAVEQGQIQAHFQPTVDLVTGRISGFEALARWIHPSRGIIPPLEFIPIAEQTGQIVQIGRLILDQACHALVGWHRRHPDYAALTVAVNLSARELDEPDLLDAVSGALARSGLQADLLTLEVTESLLMRDPELARRQLSALRELGVLVAIDDFGTGYSSLNYLEQLPVDIVKIDKSFVDRLSSSDRNVIVETITQLGTALGLRTVAEGIENSAQADILRDIGCDLGQGFLYSRPIAPHDIDSLFADHIPDVA